MTGDKAIGEGRETVHRVLHLAINLSNAWSTVHDRLLNHADYGILPRKDLISAQWTLIRRFSLWWSLCRFLPPKSSSVRVNAKRRNLCFFGQDFRQVTTNHMDRY
jgi:hypothetical protein